MFKTEKGGYSKLLKPISYSIDLGIILLLAYYLPIRLYNPILFFSYLAIGWVVISIQNEFYNVQRYAKLPLILSLLFKQFSVFFFLLYAFIGFFKETMISRLVLAEYFILCLVLVSFFKILLYFLLLQYRESLGGNRRTTVVIGDNKKTNQLIEVFNQRMEFGYDFKRKFDVGGYGFSLQQCFDYIIEHNVDEIYCSVAELKNSQLEEIIAFADNNLKVVKFVPDNKNIFTKRLKYEYYDYIPILSMRDIPLENSINYYLKRAFDVVFSGLVIVLVLSWLTPLIALLIRLESKGPIFFKQYRNGINSEEFACLKFRSMAVNKDSDKQMATKGDMRITKMGAFIRKTSIDELPQFFNVFWGQMSVVGPRPHMVLHTKLYAKKVDKYMVRHFVKPGITGLAQVRGYRGEIETDADIVNRVKFDIFYLENWTMALDIKIIIQTVLNVFQGEDKAY